MPAAPLALDEVRRLAAVQRVRLMGTPAEERFDKITRLARRMFGVSMSVIDIVGERLAWLKSVQGFDMLQVPREHSYCHYTVLTDEVILIPDAREDPRLYDNPYADVFVFYAAVPLTYENQRVGVFCIADSYPRTLNEGEVEALRDLADLAQQELQAVGLSEIQLRMAMENEHLGRVAHRLRAQADRLKHALYVFQSVRNEMGEIIDFTVVDTNEAGCDRFQRLREEVIGSLYTTLNSEAWTSGIMARFSSVVETGKAFDEEIELRNLAINAHWVHVRAFKLDDGLSITSEDITERKLREKDLEERAFVDPLTRIWNRGAIIDILGNELDALSPKKPVAVGLLDVDFFKKVNDTYGHQAGDEVLRRISERLRKTLRPTDAVGRYGGEEFLLVFPDCGEDVLHVADRIRREVSAEPVVFGSVSIPITMSIGTTFSEYSTDSVDSLIRAADLALYRAKHGGRNQVAYQSVVLEKDSSVSSGIGV